MENTGRAEQIIARAHQWNFEGDCTLLSWMQELSQNLEERANTTNRTLQQLSVGVNRAAIALDNAANSLTALQYTQFVESRCHDDDETIANVTEVPVATAHTNEHTKTPNETLKTFLRKNLEMLHKCHEKYAIQLDDSDEDEEVATNNCIYQAKNPYNDGLLPHIYGSKLWKENWHVGLCDGANEYSGDETSEAFSESSNSAEDNESYESNTANLSEWASSTSIANNENKYPTHITVQNASAIQGPPRQPPLPAAPYITGSDTSSTTSRTTSSNNRCASHEHDLFASLQDTPPTSNSSSASSRQPNSALPPPPQSNYGSASSSHRNVAVPPFYDITPPPDDIFTEAPTAAPAKTTDNNAAIRTPANQIKRKPVNLFDDDDFNSFMTEIVEKAEAKAEVPKPATRTLPVSTNTVPTVNQRKNVDDLFDETQNNSVVVAQTKKVIQKIPTTTQQPPLEIPKETARKPVNLFDSADNSPTDEPLFPPSRAASKEPEINKPTEYSGRTKITAKSLFDDDDDDDFLNVFAAKKVSIPKPTGKTLLFDDDDDGVVPNSVAAGVKEKQETQPVKTTASMQKVGLFGDDFETNEKSGLDKNSAEMVDQFADVLKENVPETQSPLAVSPNMHKPINLFVDEFEATDESLAYKRATNKINLFDDISAEIVTKPQSVKTSNEDQNNASNRNESEIEKNIKTNKINGHIDVAADTAKSQTPEKTKHTNLFDNIDEEDDDFFSSRPTTVPDKRIESAQEVVKLVPETANKRLFFEEDSDTDDLFQQPTTQTTPEKPKIVATEANAATSAEKIVINSPHSSLLFDQESANNNELVSKLPTEYKTNASDEINIDNSKLNTEVNTNLHSASEVVNKTQAQNDAQLEPAAAAAVDRKMATTNSAAITIKNAASTTITSINGIENADVSSIAQINAADLVNESAASHKAAASGANESIDVSPVVTAPQKPDSSAVYSATASADSRAATTFSAYPAADNATAAAECVTEEASAKTHKYTGIFLDEPPDDDDFFQTLNNTSSTSKFALDLEQDFYEPALPPPPSGPKEGHKPDALTNSTDYSGLRLFSEVPPDDDGLVPDVDAAGNAANNQSQRLHSVFYDDFNETMAAVQQINEQKIPTHSLFDDEPPPDDDSFDIVERLVKTREKKISEKAVLVATEQNFPQLNEAVDKVLERERVSVTRAAVPKLAADEPDKAKERTSTDIEKSRNAAGISKLQMPNIKINVQALLPGIGGKPNFKKSSEESVVVSTATAVDTTTTGLDEPTIVKESTTAPTITTKESATPNEKMLSSVCKHRVRAPAKRRPSTRKGRQENYRNSLLAEQAAALDATEIIANQVENNSVATAPKEQTAITTVCDQKAAKDSKSTENKENAATNSVNGQSAADLARVQSATTTPAMPTISNIFLDDDANEDDGALFSPQRTESAENPAVIVRVSPKQNIATDIPKPVLATAAPPTPAAAIKLHSAAASALFADSDCNDDDLFEPISAVRSTMPTATKKMVPADSAGQKNLAPANAPVPTIVQKTASLQSCFPHAQSDSEDDIFESSSANIGKPTTAGGGKKLERRVQSNNKKADSLFGSDDGEDNEADFLSNLKKPENRNILAARTIATTKQCKPTTGSGGGLFSDIESDEDDLFSGLQKAPKANTKNAAENVTKVQTDPLRMSQPAAPTPTATSTKPKTVADNPLADLLNS